VAPGESVGYGIAWTAARPSRIATLSGGYADGLPRTLASGDVRLFGGTRAAPLVGRISMDVVTADVTGWPEVPDRLDLICPAQGIEGLARAAGTIGYEILTGLGGRTGAGLGARIDRVYKGGSPFPDPP